jgi:hypothetical protein
LAPGDNCLNQPLDSVQVPGDDCGNGVRTAALMNQVFDGMLVCPKLIAETHLGPIFRTFFSAESDFPRKIQRNFLKKLFFETFSAENYIFSQHFLGKIFRGIFPEIFPGKTCTKNRTRSRVANLGLWGSFLKLV